MSSGDALQAILNLYADYALCLDERNFFAWPDFFAEECRYEVHTKENWDLGLPSAMVYCDSHGMVQDRVSVLENTLTYRYLHIRHMISNIRVHDSEGGAHKVTANYLVLHSTEEGETCIFSTGKYDAEIVMDGAGLKFRKLIVIADTSAIDNLLAVPL
jgi:3-phenylpropionate/cinnamic acid dioxygenase small subunit